MKTPMNFLDKCSGDPVDREVVSFFEGLGYSVTWDFSKRTGEHWHEIRRYGKLVAQIEMGIPLSAIKEDFMAFSNGETLGTSEVDYKVWGERTPQLMELFRKVSDRGNYQSDTVPMPVPTDSTHENTR